MWGNPDANIMRDMYNFYKNKAFKIKAHRGDPSNELADRLADEGRQSESIRWSLPTNRPIFSWTEKGITHRSPVNPTVKRRIDS